MFVWENEDIDIHEPEQKALIYFHDGVEDLVLCVSFEGAPEEFGWIVPLPAEPTLHPEDPSLFVHLSRRTQERQYRRSEAGSRLHQRAGLEGVSVLRSDTVGIYGAQVLDAASGADLEAWLTATGFRLPAGANRVLDRYVRDGWVFATLKILPRSADSLNAARLADGTIQPVRFHFPSREPVFPLEISSLAGDESDILIYLLAPEILVPRSPPDGVWDTTVFSRPGEHHWIYQYSSEAGLEEFLPDYQAPFYLTKHRARLSPERMRDVVFGPFDPAPRLAHPDADIRQETLTHLGLVRPPGSEDMLVEFLRRAKSGAETFCAIWALGEVGGARAEDALLRRAEDSDPETRLEALAALGRMGSPRATALFVRGLTAAHTSGLRERDFTAEAAQKVCFESLVRIGDPSCVAGLWQLAELQGGRTAWASCGQAGAQSRMESWGGTGSHRDPGVLALAVLAVLGEEAALEILSEAIVLGGRVASHDELAAAATGYSSVNSFPSGHWTGLALVHSALGARYWPPFHWTEELFRFAPRFRDPLYRTCAADPRLPPAGAAVLLGSLEAPEEADFARLRGIWSEALRPPVQWIDLPDLRKVAPRAPRSDSLRSPGSVRSAEARRTVRLNCVAAAVAYALSRHGRVEDLLTLGDTVAPDDRELRGEVAFAMARQRDPRFLDAVREYVREVWSAAAADNEFALWLSASEEQRRTQGRPSTILYDPPLDLPHRTRPILGYLLDAKLHGPAAAELLRDRSLHPYLRLVLLHHVPFGGGWDLEILRGEAEHLARVDGRDDPLLQLLAAEELERCDARARVSASRVKGSARWFRH